VILILSAASHLAGRDAGPVFMYISFTMLVAMPLVEIRQHRNADYRKPSPVSIGYGDQAHGD